MNVTTKMAPPIEMTQTVMLSQNGDGRVTATERTAQIPGQIDMDGQEAPLPNVMTFRKEETN